MNKKTQIYLDLTPNALKSPEAEKQIEAQLMERLPNLVKGILERGKKVHPFMTDRIGDYLRLLKEAKLAYELGLYSSTISMVGITAERLSIELTSKLRFRVNKHPLPRAELFGAEDRYFSQYKRLRMLRRAKLISEKMFESLDVVREIRNKYVHPKKKKNPEKDSLRMLNLVIDSLQSDFLDKYTFRNGKLILRAQPSTPYLLERVSE